jgi:1-acyl-sn-glycerol-3-phosphate acyltransferase
MSTGLHLTRRRRRPASASANDIGHDGVFLGKALGPRRVPKSRYCHFIMPGLTMRNRASMSARLKSLWFSTLYSSIVRFAFHRIRASGAPVPAHGPVLYVCLHRNGALDGMVYRWIVPQAKATLSSQLRRSAWMRMIFDGIELVREQDRERDGLRVSNEDSFARCVEHLAQGHELMFFPEGTSELGPRHLKFRAGVAQLIQTTLERIPSLQVVPLAAHYEAPTEWQSDVDVEVGAAISFSGKLRTIEIMRVLTAGLEAIGLDCETLEERTAIEAMAYSATLGQKDIGYAQALHAVQGMPTEAFKALQDRAQSDGLHLHQGIPLLPTRSAALYALLWLILTPLVGAAAILNLPVIAAARWASRRFADGPNVISMWRALAGTGVACLWTPVMIVASLGIFGSIPALACLAVSWAGLRSLYRWKKLTVSVRNALKMPRARSRQFLALHGNIVAEARARIAARCRA